MFAVEQDRIIAAPGMERAKPFHERVLPARNAFHVYALYVLSGIEGAEGEETEGTEGTGFNTEARGNGDERRSVWASSVLA